MMRRLALIPDALALLSLFAVGFWLISLGDGVDAALLSILR